MVKQKYTLVPEIEITITAKDKLEAMQEALKIITGISKGLAKKGIKFHLEDYDLD